MIFFSLHSRSNQKTANLSGKDLKKRSISFIVPDDLWRCKNEMILLAIAKTNNINIG